MGDRIETGLKLKPPAKGIPWHGRIVEIRAHRGEQLESPAQGGDAVRVVGAHPGHAGLERDASETCKSRDELAQLARRGAVTMRMRQYRDTTADSQRGQRFFQHGDSPLPFEGFFGRGDM